MKAAPITARVRFRDQHGGPVYTRIRPALVPEPKLAYRLHLAQIMARGRLTNGGK